MKKAIVVGGSNGIGLALVKELIGRGYFVCIADRCEPAAEAKLAQAEHRYYPCDLRELDEDLFAGLSADPEVELLMITAGFGRVAELEYLHTAEIRHMLQVNTTAAIQILRLFYERIKSDRPFYCGVMGSIAGLVSSPMFSVYAASKAAVCRFAESVNIELEQAGIANRILNVSPGSIRGTRFNGGENDLAALEQPAAQIAERLLARQELFIPEYEQTYQGVLERYAADPHAFGVSSYRYKKDSGRVVNEPRVRIGYLSGTFDLFHVGHLNLLRRAKQQCDHLIVGVHPDASHKGKETFIPYEERAAIVGAVKYVDKVVPSVPEDSEAWELWHYNKLFVGSDYKGSERFNRYEAFFKDKGVEIVYFPYTKGTSSTQIRECILAKTKKDKD